MTYRIVDLELRSSPVSVKMTVAITHQGTPTLLCFLSWRTYLAMHSFLLTLQKVLHASIMGLYPVQRHRFPEGDRAGLVTQGPRTEPWNAR